MSSLPASAAGAMSGALARLRRLVLIALLGFASGLPLALTGQALQAWLTMRGLDLATIGFLTLVGLPYTFKFLWAPLMDRFEPPGLGRRRGWMLLTQLALAGALALLAGIDPAQEIRLFALVGLSVAFLSASQDVAIDAYRTDLLLPAERGMGASLTTLGYRLAMIVSGGLAFIWVDPVQGGGWSWPEVYRLMALLMLGAAGVTALLLPRLPPREAPSSVARHEVLGFAAVLAAVALGALLTDRAIAPAVAQALQSVWTGGAGLAKKWADLLSLLLGLALTLPLAAWAARRARYETLLGGLGSYFALPAAGAMLVFIVLYKLGDAFAQALLTPFLLQAMHFSSAEVGVVNKVFGLWLSIGGALLGGLLMLRLGLWRALMLFGVAQALSNLGFWWLASHGQGAMGAVLVPAFDWGFVKLAQATPVDGGLLMVIVIENLSGGMGTAAFLAFITGLCNQRYTATHFALLSAFTAVGRVWVGPLAGVLAEAISWPSFFILSLLMALPALIMLVWLRPRIMALEPPRP
ncbi:MFS transporter [Pelomonas sp. CA6]|uniref:AmpG family muropeptide MFS transporter n=1 Tax=Pelomonas sp. CA6 TaxID=2907999 RepID=UPI001F4BE50F|nr:MFS transporter [Pelomonas sp. CA6]MCH7345497.1 MFS transporter [Pelomonas sp. CA6]